MIGLGYVGLPTAASIAACGVEVIGVDVDAERLSAIASGAARTAEEDLNDLVRTVVAAGTLSTAAAPQPADAFIIAVPTPHGPDHAPDVSFVRTAAESLAPLLRPGNLVVLESTSPVGTTEQLCAWLAAGRGDLSFPHRAGEDSDVRVAHSPERAIPGNMLHELTNNDRVVGGITAACATAAAGLYRVFVRGQCHTTTARTAELVKLTENAYRDVNIAFANEISLVCDSLGIDPWELIELANRHPRVDILKPGPGVGGHCIAVDPWFIVHSAPERTPLIQAARQVNGGKPRWVAEAGARRLPGHRAPHGRLPGPRLQGRRGRPARESRDRGDRATAGDLLRPAAGGRAACRGAASRPRSRRLDGVGLPGPGVSRRRYPAADRSQGVP